MPSPRPITLEGTAWWRKVTMMISSSPAPIVFTNMISSVAARSTDWSQSVRTPASMFPLAVVDPPAGRGLAGRPAGVFITAGVMSATRNEPAVNRNGIACASARTA
jgi:hypothetical protein